MSPDEITHVLTGLRPGLTEPYIESYVQQRMDIGEDFFTDYEQDILTLDFHEWECDLQLVGLPPGLLPAEFDLVGPSPSEVKVLLTEHHPTRPDLVEGYIFQMTHDEPAFFEGDAPESIIAHYTDWTMAHFRRLAFAPLATFTRPEVKNV